MYDLKKASTVNVDFVKTFGLQIRNSFGNLKGTCELDLVEDMIDLDMGSLLRKLGAHLGELVAFASAIIGSNISESFCECEISVVNQIMTSKRTRIIDTRLEKLTVLKMNRVFIEDMKKRYPRLFSRLNTVYSEEVRKSYENSSSESKTDSL